MLTCGSLFSGIGLLDYGLTLAGIEHAWLCEADPWRRSVLAQRWPAVPVLDDVRAVGAGTVERVDIVAGGFPCKGASTAGRRTGFEHPETVLWREMARAVGELLPRYVLVENVANILALHDGAVWGEVLGTLAALGYDVTWDCLPAAAVGAPHLRDRVLAVATYAGGEAQRGDGCGEPGPRAGADAQAGTRPAADAERVGRPAGSGLRARAEGARPGAERRGRPDDVRREAAADAERVGRGEARSALRQGRPEAQRGGATAAYAEPGRHAAELAANERDGREASGAAERHRAVAADASGDGVLQQPEPHRGRGGSAVVGRPGAAAADAGGGGQPQQPQRQRGAAGREAGASGDDALGRGVRVEWGEYEPAIRRWEAVHGAAPEPLVRRVDDRRAARMERSRLSALGDGVQVQLGQLVGEHILDLERRRMSEAA